MAYTVHLGCDHLGFTLKEAIKEHLEAKGINVVDEGCHGTESVDYPVYSKKVAKAVALSCGAALGIVICGSGVGVSLAANKVAGVRCCLCSDTYTARMSRAHNDANVLALGALVAGKNLALDIVDIFISTEFEGGRHARRVGMLEGD